MHDAWLTAFAAHLPALERAKVLLHAQLADALHGLPVQLLTSRVKHPDSLTAKLRRPDKVYPSLWAVTDLIGLRVAVSFEAQLDEAAQRIERHFRLDLSRSVDKRQAPDSSRFGYASVHYVCVAPDALALHPDFRFEVQLRTALQHAWAEVEHGLGYKAQLELAPALRRRFARVAGLLELADSEFSSLRRDVAHAEAAARSAVAVSERAVRVDALTLPQLTTHASVAALDNAIAAALRRPTRATPYYPAYLARLLDSVGLGHSTELFAATARLAAAAVALLPAYAAFARARFNLDIYALDAVESGYGLFFVAHAAVLDGEPLALGRVARFAQVYQRLDFPEDWRAAQGFASELVAALS
jgi:putative GTP pyrophosphokinase